MCETQNQRSELIEYLKRNGINVIFHYVPLHKAPYWKGKYDEVNLPETDNASERLMMLPMYYGMEKEEIEYVVEAIGTKFYGS